MKKVLLTALLGIAAISAHAVNVGVSVNIGDPNYYGSIDIGNYPPPQLVSPAPVIVAPPAVGVTVAPLYLHVPPEHYGNWRHYCGLYNACGRRVYFVHDNWYRQVYAPRYHSEHYGHHEEMRHEEERHEERHEEMRHEERHEDHYDHHDHHEDGR